MGTPHGDWISATTYKELRDMKKELKRIAKPYVSKRKVRAATTENNNSGKGLDTYRSGRLKPGAGQRQGLGLGPRDGSGPGTRMSQGQKDGTGLRAYIPRKRKPKVAIPKG